MECSVRWVFDQDNVCKPVDNLCRTWEINGMCETCYRGYIVDDGKCMEDPNKFVPKSDELCKEYMNEKCEECAERAYFNEDGKCEEVNVHCRTWDPLNGKCVTCYNGYVVDEGNCKLD